MVSASTDLEGSTCAFERLPLLDRWAMRTSVKRWLGALGTNASPTVLYLFHPSFAEFRRWIEADLVIYHAYDLHSEMPGWTQELAQEERTLANESDLVIGSSRFVVQHLTDLGATDVVHVPNGVDFVAFSAPTEEPSELRAIPRPRIGYIGSINRKVDLSLLDAIANHRPDWHMILVGEIGNLDERSESAIASLQRRSNVHFIGARPNDQLPSYMAALDVAMLVYRVNGPVWTRGIYPLKLHEYLAVGLPIVSADFPTAREFSTVVAIARDDCIEWVFAIEQAIVTRHSKREIQLRQSVASKNTWDDQTNLLERALNEVVGSKHTPC